MSNAVTWQWLAISAVWALGASPWWRLGRMDTEIDMLRAFRHKRESEFDTLWGILKAKDIVNGEYPLKGKK